MLHFVRRPTANWAGYRPAISNGLKSPLRPFSNSQKPKFERSQSAPIRNSLPFAAMLGAFTLQHNWNLSNKENSPLKLVLEDNTPQPAQTPDIPPEPPLLKILRPYRKLMSYNTENFVKTNKGVSIKPVANIQALAKAIQLEDPDMIALQEVGDRQLLKDFNEQYLNGEYPNIVCQALGDSSSIRVAMMSKDNIRVIETKSHLKEMSNGAKYGNKRDFLEATFETDTGFRFTVYNAHYRSMRGGEAHTAPIRMQEVRNAAKILKAHFTREPKAPVFVMGDFNTLHDSPLGKPIIETLTHLGDTREEGSKNSPALTEVLMKDGKTDPTHNGNGHHPNHKLDYIFTSNAMLPQIRKAYVAGDFSQAPWKQASDHLPYVTVFEELPVIQQKARKHQREEGLPLPAEKRQKLYLSA